MIVVRNYTYISRENNRFRKARNQKKTQNMLNLLPALIGAGMGLIAMRQRRRENQRAYKQQQNLMGLQQSHQIALNNQGHELQKKMWEETQYPAQMKMIKKAGLNPALLYGIGGTGGATTGTQGGGSAAGGSAPQQTPVNMQETMLGLQMDNIKAHTNKLNAEAEKTKGVDTDKINQEIDNLIEQKDYISAQKDLHITKQARENILKELDKQNLDHNTKHQLSNNSTHIAKILKETGIGLNDFINWWNSPESENTKSKLIKLYFGNR